MSKLKIEHGASKTRWVLLKTTIEEELSVDIDSLCRWSENDRKYVINELLRFTIAQAEEFQKYKAGIPANAASGLRDAAPVPAGARAVAVPSVQSDRPVVATAVRAAKEGASHAS